MSHLRITDSHAREKKKRSVVREVEGQGNGELKIGEDSR